MPRKPKPIDRARALRKENIPAENSSGACSATALFKFRRQHPIAGYVVDFACIECRLVVQTSRVDEDLDQLPNSR